jgi:hypothetical protein
VIGFGWTHFTLKFQKKVEQLRHKYFLNPICYFWTPEYIITFCIPKNCTCNYAEAPFYPTTVAIHFPSARFSYRISTSSDEWFLDATHVDEVKENISSIGLGTRSSPSLPIISPPRIIISEFTPRVHTRDKKYWIFSEEQKPARNNPEQISVFCMFCGTLTHGATAPRVLQGLYLRYCFPATSLHMASKSLASTSVTILIKNALTQPAADRHSGERSLS